MSTLDLVCPHCGARNGHVINDQYRCNACGEYSPGAPLFTVTNRHGVTFLVRIVERGDHYGRDDCLTHDNDDPMVEFYDQRTIDPTFGTRGQFVSWYYLSTLLEGPVAGINLDGVTDEWYVTAENIAEVFRYVLIHLTQRTKAS